MDALLTEARRVAAEKVAAGESVRLEPRSAPPVPTPSPADTLIHHDATNDRPPRPGPVGRTRGSQLGGGPARRPARRRRPRHVVLAVPVRQRLEHGHLQAPGPREERVWKKAMHAGKTKLHPDFGPPSYGIPLNVVEGDARGRCPSISRYARRATRALPVHGATPVEGGSDRHALTVDATPARCTNCSTRAGTVGTPRRAAARSSISKATTCVPPAGPAPTPRGCPSFPGSSATTRSWPAASGTRSA